MMRTWTNRAWTVDQARKMRRAWEDFGRELPLPINCRCVVVTIEDRYAGIWREAYRQRRRRR